MAYGRGGNDGVLLRRSGKHIRTAHWSASPHHSPLSHYHQHQPTTPILTCPSTLLLLVWITSSACFMGNLPPSPSHYKASARTPASHPKGRQTPRPPRTSGFPCQSVTPSFPSMSMVTSFAGGIITSPILFSLRSVDELRARPSAMIDSRTYI